MGFLDKLLGREEQPSNDARRMGSPTGAALSRGGVPQSNDEQAVARYRYMLQTAPPEDIERAHAEAFARLTPEQRQMALQQLSQSVPESERSQLNDDPQNMARVATRQELRQPGSLMQNFGGQGGQMGGGMMGGMGGGMMGGMGGMLAGGLLASVAGGFIGSSIAHSFFSNPGNEQSFMQSPEAAGVEGGFDGANYANLDGTETNTDAMGDPADAGTQDVASDPMGDPGNDVFADSGFDSGGDFGGDFGGGDF